MVRYASETLRGDESEKVVEGGHVNHIFKSTFQSFRDSRSDHGIFLLKHADSLLEGKSADGSSFEEGRLLSFAISNVRNDRLAALSNE